MAYKTSKENSIVSDDEFAGVYWVMAALTVVMGILLALVRIPGPKEKDPGEASAVPLPMSALLSEGRGEAAALSTVCYSVMVMVMTPTPLVMQDEGYSYAEATTVIQSHLIAMFAPSFFTGEVIKRWGERTVVRALPHPTLDRERGVVALAYMDPACLDGQVYAGCGLLTSSFAVLQVSEGLVNYTAGESHDVCMRRSMLPAGGNWFIWWV